MRNSHEEDRLLRSFGFRGRLASLNCFVDERIFSPATSDRVYKAVYIAQMLPVKRLHLAAEIAPLFVVTYGDCVDRNGHFDLCRFEPTVAHAQHNREFLSREEISRVVNASGVGLALSEVEGAMLASVEYLLCGLPVVSTPCRGGRELFFDPRFVRIAAPRASAVAEAVDELAARDVPRDVVRLATLDRVATHRNALADEVVAAVSAERGRVPTREAVVARVFGQPNGTRSVFVPFRDLAGAGLLSV